MPHTLARVSVLVAVLTVLLTGCYGLYPPPEKPLSPVPIIPHQKDVKVFAKGDTLADSLYLPMYELAVPDYAGAMPLEDFEYLAQSYGLDAVINVSNRPLRGSTRYLYSSSMLYGLGIIYYDSLDYVRWFVKDKWTYKLPERDGTSAQEDSAQVPARLVYRAHFDYRSEERPPREGEPNEDYVRYVRNYSADFLINAIENWRFKLSASTNQLVKRRYYQNGEKVLTAAFTYDRKGRIGQIDLQHHQKEPDQETIELIYDSTDRVIEKNITVDGELTGREFLYYDNLNRVDLTKYYQRQGEDLVLYLQTEYDYYEPIDFYPDSLQVENR
ncbi:hypothetical protein SAMN05421823_104181 [Catalinimonas alkaloidigena]|uniref:Uncharacterized protein n=1 Tax=Catalinimonas alkaloidigena TaxID=1075417 RepID=A0A1G9GQG3_9BACT|nr:hypothetical protein [Catalinimonas alkaloidigena]SDL02868.1 hypothetical protein SAMN05421823_104181 [Catalinimonas alkaloidigena]